MAATSTSETPTPGGRLRAIVVAVAVVIVGFVLGIVITLLAAFALSGLGIRVSLTAATVLGLVALQGVGFPLTTLAYLRLRGITFGSFVHTRLPTLRDVGWIVGGYLLVLLLVFAVVIAIASVGAPTASRANQAAFQDAGTLIWLVPLSFLLIGPGEELLFRGVVQGRLRESFGPVGAVILASASFAPAHILALNGSIQALAVSIGVLFVPALVLGTAYERTDNLWVPIIIHGAYDATLFGIVYLTLRYGATQPAVF